MARPSNSGESDMANEDFNVMDFPPSPPFLSTLSSVPPPSLPIYFPTSSNSMVVYPPSRSPSSSNSMVVYYQGSGQSTMNNPLQNQQQQPLTPSAPPISRTKPYAGISQSVSMAAPTNSEESDMATEEYLIYWNSPSPSSNSMVVYYQGSGQSSMDNPLQNRQQRPTNSGDQSDMATEEHFDVMSLLNLPQFSPPASPSSLSNSMFVYQRSGQSSMDFVDRPLYIAGDMALLRQKLLQFWMDASDEWGPRGGIMSMKKENLPQSLECLGINLLHLFVEDKFDTLLYWQGESSWEQLRMYMCHVESKVLPGRKFVGLYFFHDLERKDYGQGMFVNERVTTGVWRIGPREWVAKIRYQRHSLRSPFYRGERGIHRSEEICQRNKQVLLEDARLNFPDLFQNFRNTVTAVVPGHIYPCEDHIDHISRTHPAIDGCVLTFKSSVADYPDEDFVNGEVEPVRIEGEGTEQAEIAESQLDPGPSRKRERKEKTPTRERGNKKITRVKNVIPLDKILQVKELRLKGAAELLKVSRSALKRACREHGINRWPPRNKHEGTAQSLLDETPAVVDQEGIPQLTSDTLPSDQALTTTIDTNSVVEETAPQQFLLTVRQENPDEDSGNAEVQLVGMGGVGPREGEMRSNEKAPRRERSKYKTTGVRIELALEEIIQYKEMPLKDAARELKVSKSTLKRICRSYKIPRWPPCEEHKLESAIVVNREGIPQLNSDMLLPPNQISAPGDTNSMTVKAKYKGFRIKFQLSWPWRKVKLEQEVKKRLQLDDATYYITYKDEDDEMTLIGCDEDLEGFISSISPLGTHSIELFLEPK